MAPTAIVPVPFHGDIILAIQRPDGVFVLSIKKVFESLGIDFSTQLAKLIQCKWAVMEMVPITDTNGRHRETSVIDLDSLPLWVVTIQPVKVAPGVRQKLKTYQIEAAEVVARHFLTQRSGLAPIEVEPVLALLDSARMVRERRHATEHRLGVVENALADTHVELREATTQARDVAANAALDTVSGEAGHLIIGGDRRWCLALTRSFCYLIH